MAEKPKDTGAGAQGAGLVPDTKTPVAAETSASTKPAAEQVATPASAAKPEKPAAANAAGKEWVDLFDASPWAARETGAALGVQPSRRARRQAEFGPGQGGAEKNPWRRISGGVTESVAAPAQEPNTPVPASEPEEVRKRVVEQFGRESVGRPAQSVSGTGIDEVNMTEEKKKGKSEWTPPSKMAGAKSEDESAKTTRLDTDRLAARWPHAKSEDEPVKAATAKEKRAEEKDSAKRASAKAAPAAKTKAAEATPAATGELIPVEDVFNGMINALGNGLGHVIEGGRFVASGVVAGAGKVDAEKIKAGVGTLLSTAKTGLSKAGQLVSGLVGGAKPANHEKSEEEAGEEKTGV